MSIAPLDAALSYARRGWLVLPLHTPHAGKCSCGNSACGSPGKHPRTTHGLKDARLDEATIRRWWNLWPDANIGVVTGTKSGPVVLDLDVRDGTDGPTTAEALFGFKPESHYQRTGGGGLHCFFRRPDLLHVKSRTGKGAIAPGVELKADGGYVVVPPSVHWSDKCYEWLSHPEIDGERLPELPSWALDGAAQDAKHSRRENRIAGPIRELERNVTLTSLAGSMRCRGMTVQAIEAALLAENTARCDPPLTEKEVRRIAASIGKYPAANQARPRTNVDTATLTTDVGNAARLVKQHGKDLRYCAAWGRWLPWDGVRWRADANLEVMRRAKRTALSIYDEAKEAHGDRQEALSKCAFVSQRRERLNAMVDLARCELEVSPGDLDADGWLLNVLNGTVDLRTGELREHRREDRITKLAPVKFETGATCPLWDAFLRRITGGDAALIAYLQRIAGVCLTGDAREQVLFIFYGTGGNGKSVFLDTLSGLLGDYAAEAAPDLLIMRRSEEHPCEVADLCGKRLVVASETEEGTRLKVQLVKRLTGNARIKGRFMRQDYFEFPRTHKLVLVTNNKPKIRERTCAMWRRVRLIPFDVTIPEDEQDKELIRRLIDEWPGILRWALAGCLAWQRERLNPPEAVKAATQAYQDEQDPFREFLESSCVLTQHSWVSRTNLFAAYQTWAREAGERWPLDRTALYDRLRKQGGIAEKQRRVSGRMIRGFEGIGLLASPEASPSDAG